MNLIGQIAAWLGDGAHWHGTAGVPARLTEHLSYSLLSVVVAVVVAVPVGALVGHTGRGGFLVVGLGNALRALPTLGLLTIVVLLTSIGLLPPVVVLVVLAVPPIMLGTYSGVRAVDPAVVDAARGVGMRGGQVLVRVELPNALPLVLGGIRSATLQVIATATIAAYVGLGGLGRFVIDGLALRQYDQVVSGAVLVALLAVLVDLVLAVAQRYLVSPGLRVGRHAASAGRERGRIRGAGAPAAAQGQAAGEQTSGSVGS
jgi:osmoprotectant transport system permease protein